MRGLRLWEINAELDGIAERLVENGGELSPEDEEALDELDMAFDDKIEGIALHILNLRASAEVVKSEANRLSAKKRAFENAEKRLKAYAQRYMEMQGKERVETDRATVRIQNNPPSFEWMGELDGLPEEYKRVSVSPNLARVKEDVKAGAEIPDGFRQKVTRSLRIA